MKELIVLTQHRPSYRYQIDDKDQIVRAGSREGGQYRCKIVLDNVQPELFPKFSSQQRDLSRVAAALHCVDRISPKNLPSERAEARNLHSYRDMDVQLRVENLELWQEVAKQLEELLWFMTNDRWTISFKGMRSPSSSPLTKTEKFDEVALSSGGLDSIAGLWVSHRRHIQQPKRFATVSVYGDGARKSYWQKTHAFVREHLKVNAKNVYYGQRAESDGGKDDSRVKKLTHERTRGFRYWGIGAALAHSLGMNQVVAYETGIGALNIPFNEAQLGAQNTRAMHPGALFRMEGVLSKVLGEQIRLELPFFFLTKGELCLEAGPMLKDLAENTMSCDEGETRKKDSKEHCGHCTSCLFRRAALHQGFGNQDPTRYRLDRQNASYFQNALKNQAKRLLETCGSYQKLLELEPDIFYVEEYFRARGMPYEKIQENTRSLFERYAKQTSCFLEKIAPL